MSERDPLGSIKQCLEKLGLTGEQEELIQDFIIGVSVAEGLYDSTVLRFLKRHNLLYINYTDEHSLHKLLEEIIEEIKKEEEKNMAMPYMIKVDVPDFIRNNSEKFISLSHPSPGAFVPFGGLREIEQPNEPDHIARRLLPHGGYQGLFPSAQITDVYQALQIAYKLANYGRQFNLPPSLRHKILLDGDAMTSTTFIMKQMQQQIFIGVKWSSDGTILTISINGGIYKPSDRHPVWVIPKIPREDSNLNLIARMSL